MWSTTVDLALPTFLYLSGAFYFLLRIFLVKKKMMWEGEEREIKHRSSKQSLWRQRNNEKGKKEK